MNRGCSRRRSWIVRALVGPRRRRTARARCWWANLPTRPNALGCRDVSPWRHVRRSSYRPKTTHAALAKVMRVSTACSSRSRSADPKFGKVRSPLLFPRLSTAQRRRGTLLLGTTDPTIIWPAPAAMARDDSFRRRRAEEAFYQVTGRRKDCA